MYHGLCPHQWSIILWHLSMAEMINNKASNEQGSGYIQEVGLEQQEMGLETRLYLHSNSGKEQVHRLSLNGPLGQWAEGALMGVPDEGGLGN